MHGLENSGGILAWLIVGETSASLRLPFACLTNKRRKLVLTPVERSRWRDGRYACSQGGFFLGCNGWFFGDNRPRCAAPTFLNDAISRAAEAIKRRNPIQYPYIKI